MLSPPLHHATPTHARTGDRTLVTFAGCNYLGLAHHPAVLGAAEDAARRYGLSTSASRTTSGNTDAHEALEHALRDLTGFAGAALTPDGYTANIAAAQGVARMGTRVAVLDERAHRSQPDAARAAGLEIATYRHADASDAARVLREVGAPALVMTDGVFTADGSIAPIADLRDALTPGSKLLIDDCHATGVLGPRGAGTLAHAGLTPDARTIVTTTLAKGIGCAGGVVLAEPALIDEVRADAGAFVCTTPPSPALTAGALAALRIASEDDARRERLARNARTLRSITGSDPDAPTPISAFVAPTDAAMRTLAADLEESGVFVPMIGYPGGPASVYFRASVTSEHTPAHLDQLRAALASLPRVDTAPARQGV